jgi:hypothetical protein
MKKKVKKKLVPPVDNCMCPWCGQPLQMIGFCEASRMFDVSGGYAELLPEDTEYSDFTTVSHACSSHKCEYEFTTERDKIFLLHTLYKIFKNAEAIPVLPDSAAPEAE